MTVAHFFQGWRQREVWIVVGLVLLSLVLSRVPVISILFYPFLLFNTVVHELGHGLAALLTGGNFHRFVIFPNGNGLAYSSGGIRWIVVSAGYVGSALFGGALIIISSFGVSARRVLFWLGIVLGILCVLYMRNLFGFFVGALMTAGLITAGKKLSDFWAYVLLLFLAVQSMLNALDSVFGLVTISLYHRGIKTDAQSMAEMTFLPAVFWAVLYSGLAIGILVLSLIVAYRRNPAPR